MHNLDLVQMAHAKDKRPAEISGGMKQRVGLARALAMEPKVLLLDEPFGALDALTRAHLQDSVMAIHQKLGNTVLMITHDVDEAVLLSDRIVMMTNGPAARIGEILDVPLQRPRKRLAACRRRDLSEMPPARARVPLRAPSLRRSGLTHTMSGDFSPEQKRYLEGFTSGLQIARAGRGLGGKSAAPVPSGPDAEHLLAQDRTVAAGGKLNEQEKIKREQHPFDAYSRLKEQADNNEFPKPADTFRWKYYGLFYVSPAQNSYMCRLRMPNGILKHWQLSGLADLAERYGGGYSHVTTRANLQIREIEAKNAVALLEAIQDLGLCSRGSGADNIRNVTGTPTAGIDPQELIDTRPYAREWHFHILNERALYGLPRKFNVAFDGAGTIAVLEDTNDIGFQAVEVKDGFGVSARRLVPSRARRHHRAQGFRPRHRRDREARRRHQGRRRHRARLHRPRRPHQPQQGADEIRARRHGLREIPRRWSRRSSAGKLARVPAEAVAPRPVFDRAAHIGVHAQKQTGLHWIGVVLPVGKLTAAQMRGLAAHRAADLATAISGSPSGRTC